MGIFLDLEDEDFVAVDCHCFNYLYKAENFKRKKTRNRHSTLSIYLWSEVMMAVSCT